ncbi:putative transcription factor C2C2-GATA family [Helianthus annuus]|nr:putative transcription factor C2C2-GATA family [Helianthus annuus]
MGYLDKRMCKTESGISGVTFVDYNNNNNNDHRVYDEDCFGDILNMFDLPMESLDGDGLAEDWAAKLGPIPSEVFRELVPPAPQTSVGSNFGYSMASPFEYPLLNNKTSQQQYHLKQQPAFDEDRKLYPSQASFHAPSPNSVLESRTSSSNTKGVSFGIEISIPVRTRSKRLRPTANPWLTSPIIVLPNKDKKRKKPSKNPVNMETKRSLEKQELVGIKKCAHCEITKTPQWREGPMGPKTLCNACGVRYRSGRLYPEYRPAASPTFVPALHSNSHRKVIEMRQKAVM